MSLIGYARVSTVEGRQILDRQLDALRAAGCERVFEEHGSGADPDRPILAACRDHLRLSDVQPSSTSTASGGGPRSSSR